MSTTASPQTPLEELTALPRPLSWFQVALRHEGNGREGKGGMGKGEKRGSWGNSALIVGDRHPWTFPLKMHHGGKKMGQNRGKDHRILTPQRKHSYFFSPQLLCNISSKSNKNCDRRSADRQTDRPTERQTEGRKWFYNLPLAMLQQWDR